MARFCYLPKRFSTETLVVIEQANAIIGEYEDAPYALTLRQLYYQFVARGLLPNEERQYKRLSKVLTDARCAGRLDWESMDDRTRALRQFETWSEPTEILEHAARGFRTDKWATQPIRVEAWVEKEALAGVFEAACEEFEVPLLSCRGYSSASVIWRAAQRHLADEEAGQATRILYFGDHDPSGIDMSRDIQSRLAGFDSTAEVLRVALNLDQVRRYEPPPNPAKLSDSRSEHYVMNYGPDSWELDALDPATLTEMLQREIREVLDPVAWEVALRSEQAQRERLALHAARFESD